MSRKKIDLNTKQILRRVGIILGTDENARIAEALGVAPQVCTNWKTRNTIPWPELHAFSHRSGVSLDWLITGREKPGVFGSTWPDGIKQTCQDLAELLMDSNASLKEAALANLELLKLTQKELKLAKRVKRGAKKNRSTKKESDDEPEGAEREEKNLKPSDKAAANIFPTV